MAFLGGVSVLPACRRHPGRRNTGLRTAATACRGGGNVRLRSSAPPTAEGERCAAPIGNRHIARPWGTADLRWLTDARTEWGVCLGEVHRGLFGHGGDGEELVPDAAVDAFAGFAVVAAQLDERLRDEGGVGFESAFFK